MKEHQSVTKHWQEVSAEVTNGMMEWRQKHPRATLREIERELDQRLARLRARMLEDAAMLSEKREWVEGAEGAPTCPECGQELQGRSRDVRQLQTDGEVLIQLERQYGVCPQCGQGFFPPG